MLWLLLRRELEAAWLVGGNSRWPRGQSRTCLLPIFLFLCPAAATAAVAAAATAAAAAELVTWAPAELPGCCLGGGLSKGEEGAAKSEISIVTQDAPGAERDLVREEEAPARRQPAALGALQPPRAVPEPASLSHFGSD